MKMRGVRVFFFLLFFGSFFFFLPGGGPLGFYKTPIRAPPHPIPTKKKSKNRVLGGEGCGFLLNSMYNNTSQI
jgi:hypothetical protein